MNDFVLSPVVTNILGIMVTAIGLGLLWLLVKASSWIGEKIKEVKADWEIKLKDSQFNEFFNTMQVTFDTIQDIVNVLNVTFKKELLEKSNAGKISKEDGKKLLNKAIELVMLEISDHQKEILETGIDDLEEWVRTQIEKAVEKAKDKPVTVSGILENTAEVSNPTMTLLNADGTAYVASDEPECVTCSFDEDEEL